MIYPLKYFVGVVPAVVILLLTSGPIASAVDYFFDADNQPWYTINTPRAIHKDGKTYIAFQHTSMDPYVTVYDHATGTMNSAVRAGISDIPDDDTHGNPVIWFDSLGHLYVTYGGHGSPYHNPQKVAKSDSPGSITSFTEIDPFDDRCTYPQMHQKSDGSHIIVYRRGGHNIGNQTHGPWSYRTSDDGGNSWSTNTSITDGSDGDLYAFSHVGPDDVLHLTIVWESQPSIGRQDIYYAYMENGKWYNQHNTEIIGLLGLTNLNNQNCKIFDTGGDRTTHVPDMQTDAQGNLYLGIASASTGNFTLGKRINGGTFQFHTIADGCTAWHSSAALDVTNENEITAYVNAHGGSQGGQLEEWQTTDGGLSWTKLQNITSFNDAYSLQLVRNHHDDAKLVFERASDHTLYLWGDSGFVGTDGQASPAFIIGGQEYEVSSFDTNQDAGNYQIDDNGHSIILTGNSWKKINLPYTITNNTVIEFDFKSTVEGEIHGIAFETDDTIDTEQVIQVFGTQTNVGVQDYHNYQGSGGRYAIHIGDHYVGDFEYLVFVNDDDADAAGNSTFSNIHIYERGSSADPGGSISSPRVAAYSDKEDNLREPANVVDGVTDDPEDRWSALGFPQWIELDLGSDQLIEGVQVHTFLERAYQYTVQARPEAGNYTTVIDRSANTTGGNPISDTFPTTTARYVRLEVTGASGYTGSWVSLLEIEILEATDSDPYSVWSNGIAWGAIPVSDRDPDDNPDGDGLDNLLEMAFDTNPTTANILGYPQYHFEKNGDGTITVSMTYPKASDDVVYTPKVSDNLIDWSESGFSTEMYDSITELYERMYMLPENTSKIFFQMEVSIAGN